MPEGEKGKLRFKRILLKISGEAFCDQGENGISVKAVQKLAGEIRSVARLGVETAVVMGAGNMIRGAGLAAAGVERVIADQMGMLSTLINALVLRDALEKLDLSVNLLSAVEVSRFADSYVPRKGIEHLEKKRVLLLPGGTGNPYFTTDTCAALRAVELKADVLLKATKVDGVYSDDPEKNASAEKFDTLSYKDAMSRNLKVMDQTAFALCRENYLPILVFTMKVQGNIEKAVLGEKIGTFVGASAMDYDEVLLEIQDKMEKALFHLSEEFRGIRSGRATPGLVEFVKVNYYGALTPLKQMATIAIPEPRSILIKPFDRSALGEIEKAILKSEIGITPNNDGKVVRLQVPVLSEERRKQLVSRVKEISEGARVSIRNIRREGNKKADQLEKDSTLSEDEQANLKEEIQKETKDHEKKIEDILNKKIQELMET